MKSLVKAWWGAGLGPNAMDELRGLFQRKLAETRDAVRRHQDLERELVEGLAYLETCRECAAPSAVVACAKCSQDHGMRQEPALVAGITSAPGATRRSSRSGFVRIEEIE